MGFVALFIGGVIGYLLSEIITAKNWTIKLLYAIGIPIVLFIIIAAILMEIFGSSYAGSFSAYLVIANIAYTIAVLLKMKNDDNKKS